MAGIYGIYKSKILPKLQGWQMKNTAVVVFGSSPGEEIKIAKYLKACCNRNERRT
jgi:hypothetical protein